MMIQGEDHVKPLRPSCDDLRKANLRRLPVPAILPAMIQWFYTRDGKQNGPVTFDQLREIANAGGLDPKGDLVWNSTMTSWSPAGTIDGIFRAPTVAVSPSRDLNNPYAPPSLDPVAVIESAPLEEIVPGSDPIDVMACIKRGFTLTKRNFGMILLVGLVFLAITYAIEIPLSVIDPPRQITRQIGDPETNLSMYYPQFTPTKVVHFIISQLVAIFLGLGLSRIALDIISGGKPSVGQLFSQGDKMGRAIVAALIYYLAVAIGMLLLIVPGVYLALRFSQYQMAIVDKNLGIKEAFAYSSEITKNNRLNLLGLMVMAFLIVVAGLVALCFGVAFTAPMAWLSLAVAYRWMRFGSRGALEDRPGI